MDKHLKSAVILMADDDPDDRFLTQEALKESALTNEIRFVGDGEALLDYLYKRGRYTSAEDAPRPGLILLDLNMPKKDGRDVLREIKNDPGLRQIPIVILTTSKTETDIYHSYDLGANSFITKPSSFDGLVNVMNILGQYWFDIAELPTEPLGG